MSKAEMLRQKAEELLKKKSFESISISTEADTQKLIHELQVHQIELEMQNEELMRANEEAEIAVKKYTELYDFAPSGYFTLSREGKIVELNLKGANVLGEERQRLLNNIFRFYVSEDTRTIFNRFLDRAFETENEESCEVSLIGKATGEQLWVKLTGLYDRNNEFCKIIMVNINENKKAEKELREIGERLVQLNADKDRFISILGHDLKNPFSNILGLSEMLAGEINSLNTEEIEEIAKIINTSAIITNKLLDDILMWARAKRGTISYQPHEFALGDILSDLLEVLNPSAYSKGITISSTNADQIKVYADIDMFKTILLNLVSNALKFTNKGGTINISAERTDSNITVSVSDNGIGIEHENLSKLFDISEVLNTNGTAGETGTGLGLLLCKEFVEKHSGKIWVESEVGKGSDFKFSLPIYVEKSNCMIN